VALFGLYFNRWEIRPPAFGVGSKVFQEIGQARCVGNADRMENDLAMVGIDTHPVFTSGYLRADAQVAKRPLQTPHHHQRVIGIHLLNPPFCVRIMTKGCDTASAFAPKAREPLISVHGLFSAAIFTTFDI
jgi:hypothetical protein